MDPTPRPPVRAAAEPERPPAAVLLVLTWDVVLAIGVLFIAFASFGGGVEVHGRTTSSPLAVQILQALGFAAYGAVLILLATVLVKRAAWVRRTQVVALALAAAIGVVTFVVDQVATGSGVDTAALLGTAMLALVDMLALFAMTGSRVTAWYRDPGPVPFYMGALIAFWSATSVAFFVLRLLS